MFCASAHASAASAQSYQKGIDNPWRKALRADLALPPAVFGPVLARAFARLAFDLRAVVMLRASALGLPARPHKIRRPQSVQPRDAGVPQIHRAVRFLYRRDRAGPRGP
jgi:hypothetical protein